MLRILITVLFAGVGSVVSVQAFLTPSFSTTRRSNVPVVVLPSPLTTTTTPSSFVRPVGVTFLELSSSSSSSNNDDEELPPPPQQQKKRPRRRRRKETVVSSSEEEQQTDTQDDDDDDVVVTAPSVPPPPVPELKAREDTPVELEIQDIRNIMSSKVGEEGEGVSTIKNQDTTGSTSGSTTTTTTTTTASSSSSSMMQEEEDDDDDEYEYYYEDDDGNEIVVPDEQVDSLSQLLADARQMREQEDASAAASQKRIGDDDDDDEKGGNGGGITVPESVRNVISTIVTADFFLVCALLVWFLTGIATRAIFHNDTIQIAFNNNFELIVQPALGVLMIGAGAGAVLKEEETE